MNGAPFGEQDARTIARIALILGSMLAVIGFVLGRCSAGI